MSEGKGTDNSQRVGHWKAFEYILLLCAITIFYSSAVAARPPPIAFNIPAEEFETSVAAFATQAKVDTSYGVAAGNVHGVRTHAIVGMFEPHQALALLLEGTGIEAEWVAENSVWFRRIDPGASTKARIVEPTPVNAAGSAEPVPELNFPVEQVLVTGSLIHGVDSITAPLVTLGTGGIDDVGYSGAQSIVNTLPLASNNTPREDFSPVAGIFNSAEGINLRSLGVGATLVLVDGYRQPLTGWSGSFFDVLTVPSAAIDHIEILPDGASALYGSDAIGGVVNIVLRHEFDGAETSAHYALGEGGGDETRVAQVLGSHWDGGHGLLLFQYTDCTAVPISSRSYADNPDRTAEGGSDFRSPNANPGNILNPATGLPAFAIPSGQNGETLSVSQLRPGQVNLQNQLQGTDIYPQRATDSLYVTAEQDLWSSVRGFLEGRFDRREEEQLSQAWGQTLIVPASNAFYVNPFGQSTYVPVAYSFADDLGNEDFRSRTTTATMSLGLKADLLKDWHATLALSDGISDTHAKIDNLVSQSALSAALADSNPATAFNPFGAGSNTARATLNQISGNQGEYDLYKVPDLSLAADGPLLSWHETSAKLALGADLRQESLQTLSTFVDSPDYRDEYQREVGSVFGELAVNVPGHIEVSLAGRYEHYSDFGSTTNPKVGVRWTPLNSIKLRAGWSTSFRAPELSDLDLSKNAAGLTYLPDPKSPTGQSLVLFEEGNLPHLHPETAATWTAGLDFVPQTVPGLKASVTYYATDYRSRIVQPGPTDVENILEQESLWQQVIQRNPAPATIMAICNSREFHGSPSDCQNTPPAVIVDIRLRNMSRTIDKGVDLTLDQPIGTEFGIFRWKAQGAYILAFDQQVSNTAPVTSTANTITYPIKVRARATAGWSERRPTLPGFSLDLAINYQGSYLDDLSTSNRRIASDSTLDAQLGYTTGEGQRWFENTEIRLSASNFLNANPPFANTLYGFDQNNTPPLARLITVSFKKTW